MKKLHLSDPSRRGAAPGALIWMVALVIAFLVSLGIAIISSNDAEAARGERDSMRADRDSATQQLETELDTVTAI